MFRRLSIHLAYSYAQETMLSLARVGKLSVDDTTAVHDNDKVSKELTVTGLPIGHIERVLRGGYFDTILAQADPVKDYATPEQAYALQVVDKGENVLITGPACTGKFTLLRRLGKACEAAGKRVAYTSAHRNRSSYFENDQGFPFSLFIGESWLVKHVDKVIPTLAQATGTIRRHLHNCLEHYENALPHPLNVDVLVLDSIECVNPVYLEALDTVLRNQRTGPDGQSFSNKGYGGLQIIASANFWETPKLSPMVPYDSFIFQTNIFQRTFPIQILMERFWNHFVPQVPNLPILDRTVGKETLARREEFSYLTRRAFYGCFHDTDRKRLEKICKPLPTLPVAPMVDCGMRGLWAPKMCNYRWQWFQARNHFKDYERQRSGTGVFASFAQEVLRHTAYAENVGLYRHLHVMQDSIVTLLLPFAFPNGSVRIPRGATGIVRSVEADAMTVDFLHGNVVKFGRLRVETRLNRHPLMSAHFNQFPVMKVNGIFSAALRRHGRLPLNLHIDGRLLTETHDLGCLMARSSLGPDGILISNATIHANREGMIHDAVRNYYEELMRKQSTEAWLTKFDDDAQPRLHLLPTAEEVAKEILEEAAAAEVQKQQHSQAVDDDTNGNQVNQTVQNEATRCAENKSALNGETATPTPGVVVNKKIDSNKKNKKSRKEQEQNVKLKKVVHSNWVVDLYSRLFDGTERFCRNCKTHFPVEEFFHHWKPCVKSVKWCAECAETVPREKWEGHNEKHTVVLCVDCCQPMEFQYWERHRYVCRWMVKELDARNEMLPEVVTEEIMSSGADPKRDLHSTRKISKGIIKSIHSAEQISKRQSNQFLKRNVALNIQGDRRKH